MTDPTPALTQTALPTTPALRLLSRGKVRDLYTVHDDGPDGAEGGGEAYLLFVATDRVSAFDVIMQNGIPGKGKLLTQLSAFWFARLAPLVSNHVVAVFPPSPFAADDADTALAAFPPGVRRAVAPHAAPLAGRTLLVRPAHVVPLEAIVRGYLTGSAWAEYKKTQTVHGIAMPADLVESTRLDPPLFTPSTKAAPGTHDENISPEQASELVGAELYARIARTAVALYTEAHAYALTRGLILADTKFEFGLVSHGPSSEPASAGEEQQLILIDEALTPDSSRYWSAAAYAPGRAQRSFDKQFLRDWLVGAGGFRTGLEGGPDGAGWWMSDEVVRGTRERYEEAVRLLVGPEP